VQRAMTQAATETLVGRDRLITLAALCGLVVAAWAYLLYLAYGMSNADMSEMVGMPGMSITMPDMHAWSWVEFYALVVMWAVMMVAMMIPAAAPMILTFAAVHRRRTAEGRPAVPTSIFVLGYVLVWTLFSVAAAAAQALLHARALLSPEMSAASPVFAGVLLVGAGVFQWTPLKRACLSACRSPLSFLMGHWREGRGGALVLGVEHGVYCLGCCWALMGLLFLAGVMNLLWVAGIAVIVLTEKVAPRGELLARMAGVILVVAGLGLIARANIVG
jgi:predicted metal-binding membrane protein